MYYNNNIFIYKVDHSPTIIPSTPPKPPSTPSVPPPSTTTETNPYTP